MIFSFFLCGYSFHSILGQVFKCPHFDPLFENTSLETQNWFVLAETWLVSGESCNVRISIEKKNWLGINFFADVNIFPSNFRTFQPETGIALAKS